MVLTNYNRKWGVNFCSLAEDDVAKLLKDCGVAADKAALKTMMTKLAGKSIPEMIAEGKKEFASMPSGGAPSAAPVEEKKAEVKKEEPKEEEVDVDMGDLFGY